jgi:hypothetical protein
LLGGEKVWRRIKLIILGNNQRNKLTKWVKLVF